METGSQKRPDSAMSTLPATTSVPMDYDVVELKTEMEVNSALAHITAGKVGFDAEMAERTPTFEEEILLDHLPESSPHRRGALLGLQLILLFTGALVPIDWTKISLCLIQIAYERTVWVIHLTKIKAYPSELKRILESPHIVKAGAGVVNDVQALWRDLLSDMQNVYDVGFMARLAMAERFPGLAYTNVGLEACAAEYLGWTLDKTFASSPWRPENGELSPAQIQYAAQDAMACLLLYGILGEELRRKSKVLDQTIPKGWYSFNSRFGELFRIKKSFTGEVIPWRTKDCTWYANGKFQGYP